MQNFPQPRLPTAGPVKGAWAWVFSNADNRGIGVVHRFQDGLWLAFPLVGHEPIGIARSREQAVALVRRAAR
jgi:hypothetical protein